MGQYDVCWFWLSIDYLESYTPFADEGCENNLSIRGTGKLLEDSEEFIFCAVHNHFVSFNMSPACFGACMDLLQVSR